MSREEKCQPVVDALDDLDLPRVVRQMLAGMIPKSLGVPPGKRGSQQAAVVGMLEKSLEDHDARMQAALADLEEKRGSSDQKQAAREEKLKAAESALAARESVREEAIANLAEITLAVRAAKKEVAAAEEAKSAAEVGLKAAEKEKADLVCLRDENYEPLKAGSCETTSNIKKRQAGVATLGGLLTVPASLMTALPGVLQKPPSERGTFDVMVTDQFDAELARKIAALDETLTSAAPAAAEREGAVAAAEASLGGLKVKQRAAVQVQREAESGKDGTEETKVALQEAQRAVKDFLPEMQLVDRQCFKKLGELEAFRDGVLVPFRKLRDPPAESPAAGDDRDDHAAEQAAAAAA
jgi:hypothetical protein